MSIRAAQIRPWLILWVFPIGLSFLVSCASETSEELADTPIVQQESALDQRLSVLIKEKGIYSNPAVGMKLSAVGSSKAQLGKKLFFSRSLSGNKQVACVTCHHPLLMGGDGLSLPVGVEAIDNELIGPGRQHNMWVTDRDDLADGAPNVPRNSMTVFNSALYRKALFWDGSLFPKDEGFVTPESTTIGHVDLNNKGNTLLASQALLPLVSVMEMRGHDFAQGDAKDNVRSALLQRFISEQGAYYQSQFIEAFDLPVGASSEEAITLERIASALAAYIESQLFIDNAWFRYLEGDLTALDDSAKRGAALFYRSREEGGMACAECHASAHFSDEKNHIAGFPQLGRGKGALQSDLGHFLATKEDKDAYKFRTPSLLNVALTAPYGHAGSFATLDDVVDYHLAASEQVAGYDFTLDSLPQFRGSGYPYNYAEHHTKLAIAALARDEQNILRAAVSPQLSVSDLKAFLNALSDQCLLSVNAGDERCLKAWLLPNDSIPEQFNSKFSQFSYSSVGWDLGSDMGNSAPPDAVGGSVDVDVAQCSDVYPDNTGPDSWRFEEVTNGSGLSYESPKYDLTQLNVVGEGKQLETDAYDAAEYAGMIVAGDYNGDDYPDLIVSSGIGLGPRVMINNRDGTFSDKTSEMGLANWGHQYLMGGGVADLDGDGDLDLVLTGRNMNAEGDFLITGFMSVYRFEANRWIQVPQVETVARPILSVSFSDYNSDEKLDIFVASWSRLQGVDEQYLWENEGGLQFKGVGDEAGIVEHIPVSDFTFSPVNVDLTGNAYADLVMVSDFRNTFGLFNLGNAKYEAQLDGMAPNVFTDGNGMGVASADYDNDGDMDVFISSIHASRDGETFPGTGNRLYINDGKGRLSEADSNAGLLDGGWGWGACAADFNEDGYTDIFHTNGFGGLQEAIDSIPSSYFDAYYHDKSKLFISNGDGSFTEKAVELGLDDDGQGRGVACLDYDQDGDIDIAISQNFGPTKLFENKLNTAASKLVVKLEDRVSGNTEAIGAKLWLRRGLNKDLFQYKEVQANTNFISQSTRQQHFGLGDSVENLALEIQWPRPLLGRTVIENIGVNRCLKVSRKSSP